MTIISAMKLEKGGAMVCDEQASTSLRKYDFARKIHTVEPREGMIILYGGSGGSDFLYEVHKKIAQIPDNKEILQNIKSADMVVARMSAELVRAKRNHTRSNIYASSGVTEDDLQRGYKITSDGQRVEFEKDFKDNAWRTHNTDSVFHQMFNGAFLVLAHDAAGVEIYEVTSSHAQEICIARPYSCIGSGSDMADAELSTFIEGLPREERDDIDYIKGIEAMLFATERAARKNQGVGGTPYIAVIHEGKVKTPAESASRMAREVVLASKAGYLNEDFVHAALTELIYEDLDFRKVDTEMHEAAGERAAEMDRMLRGYRV